MQGGPQKLLMQRQLPQMGGDWLAPQVSNPPCLLWRRPMLEAGTASMQEPAEERSHP